MGVYSNQLASLAFDGGGGGGASFLGGIRSFILSRPLASSKLAILCVGENPASAAGGWEE